MRFSCVCAAVLHAIPIGLQWWTGSIFDMVTSCILLNTAALSVLLCAIGLVVKSSFASIWKTLHSRGCCIKMFILSYSDRWSLHPTVEQAAALLPDAGVCFHISAPFMLALASCWTFLIFPNSLIPLLKSVAQTCMCMYVSVSLCVLMHMHAFVVGSIYTKVWGQVTHQCSHLIKVRK